MIHDLRPYPAMKDSGVPWLGQVPEHWEVSSSKWLFKASKELARPDDVQLSATQAYGVIPQEEYERRSGSRVVKISMHLEKRKHVEENDFVISMRSFQGGLERAWASGAIRSSYVVLKPQPGTDVEFYSYLFKSHDYIRALQSTAGFIRDGQDLTEGNFRQVDLPLPPLVDQRAIGSFLSYADRRIRRAIAAKQRLIKLLREQKQVIIHQAVTRGLDPNVKLTPSGVEWLGDVPEGWTVAALRLRYSVQLGKMLDSKRITGEHSVPYLRNTDVQWGKINKVDLPVMDIPSKEYQRYTVKSGDLLVCEGGEVGRCAIWSGDGSVFGYQKALHRVRPLRLDNDSPEFLYYIFFDVAKRGIFRSDGSENTIAHLTAEKLRAYRFAFPPLVEQMEIVRHLKSSEAVLEEGVSRAQQEISLLREYRTRLIADVVTGKLDVREAALFLPELEAEAVPDEMEGDAEGEELEADEVEAEGVEA